MKLPAERLGVSNPWTDPRIEVRKRAADAERAKQARIERAMILQRRGQTGLTEEGEKALFEATKHHRRAKSHHRAVTRLHDATRDEHEKLRTAHRKLRARLSQLDVDDPVVAEQLNAASDHMDGARDALEAGADHVENLGAAVNRAARCVRSVIMAGLEESAPEDPVESDEQSEFETRTSRRARLERASRLRGLVGPRAV